MFALSVDVLWGYGGLLSFGQAVFFGLGCYGYAVITTGRVAPVPPEAGLIGVAVGVAVPILIALFLGYFLFYGNVTGPYFTIVTLALAFLVSSLALAWPKLFGGWTGIPNVPALKLDFLNYTFSQGSRAFILSAVAAVAMVMFVRWLLESRFGLLVNGLRDNEARLQYLGASVARIKLLIFVLSAGLGGLAGALFAAQSGYVSSDLLGIVVVHRSSGLRGRGRAENPAGRPVGRDHRPGGQLLARRSRPGLLAAIHGSHLHRGRALLPKRADGAVRLSGRPGQTRILDRRCLTCRLFWKSRESPRDSAA